MVRVSAHLCLCLPVIIKTAEGGSSIASPLAECTVSLARELLFPKNLVSGLGGLSSAPPRK